MVRTTIRAAVLTGVVAAAMIAATGGAASAATALPGAPAAPASGPLLGGWSNDYQWYNANVGSVRIYRTYDPGFQYPTWQDTFAFKAHGNAPEDYSFQLPPADIASGKDDAILRTFLATTPKDLIVTNYHEPEQEIDAGLFTAAQFRASLVRLSQLVRAQNAADGGARRTSLILMRSTIGGFRGRVPASYWPGRDPSGRNWVDVMSFDIYAAPHATKTPGVPEGFTDGVNWKTSQFLIDKPVALAAQWGTPWMISEFGFLEDIHDPMHKARAITDFVAYAKAKGALAIEYWDSVGGRANWRLRYAQNALNAWKAAVAGS